MAEKNVRFGFVTTQAEIDALNEWCWQNRIKSVSAAVRALIADGIRRDPPEGLAGRKVGAAKKGAGDE